MATEDYVAVAADDWYQRRREDDEGEFFRKVANQGPRKGEGGATRQGIYCFTAAGQLLAYKNAGQAPDVMRDVLKNGLAAWNKLPPAERKPGAVQVDGPRVLDATYARNPPAGGLVVNVFTRALDRDANGKFCDAKCKTGSGDEVGRDHLWLTQVEQQSLAPVNATVGQRIPLSRAIAERILRFHLVDNTRGEPPMWRVADIRTCDINLTVESVNAVGVTLRMQGHVLLATSEDPQDAQRGFDAKLTGQVHYDSAKRKIDRFDLIAIGDHWGEGSFTRGARPGRTPLGVAFELASEKSLDFLVPPQGARELADYMGSRAR